MYSQILHKGSCDIVLSASFVSYGRCKGIPEIKTEHKNIHIITNTDTGAQSDLFRERFQFEL